MLIGDAAHAMVPFHGQGMNCCFEDCVEFDACVEQRLPWEKAFAQFGASRKPNTDAIAAMALENIWKCAKASADPDFQLQQALSWNSNGAFRSASFRVFHGDVSPRNPLSDRTAARRDAGRYLVRPHARRGGTLGHRLRASELEINAGCRRLVGRTDIPICDLWMPDLC